MSCMTLQSTLSLKLKRRYRIFLIFLANPPPPRVYFKIGSFDPAIVRGRRLNWFKFVQIGTNESKMCLSKENDCLKIYKY